MPQDISPQAAICNASARNVGLDRVVTEGGGMALRSCRIAAALGEGNFERDCDAPSPVSRHRLRVCHRSGLRCVESARTQGRSGPSGTERSARGRRPSRTAGATRTRGRARATGAARSCFTNTDHPGELCAPVLHHPVRAGRSARDCLLRRQKEVGNLPYREFCVVWGHTESSR
jgi:hypothetical protein